MVSPFEFRHVRSANWSAVQRRMPRAEVWALLGAILLGIGFSQNHLAGQELREESVYYWRFGIDDDRNLDYWPDGWQRRRDRAHPVYVEMELVPKDPAKADVAADARNSLIRLWRLIQTGRWEPEFSPEATPPELMAWLDRFVLDNCLEIRMNGGAAELASPLLRLDPRFSYRVQCDLLVDSLLGHQARVDLEILDAAERSLRVLSTPSLEGSTGWRIGLSTPDSPFLPQTRFGRIRIRVTPTNPHHITGTVRVDNIRLLRMPRLQLSTSMPLNVVHPGHPFRVRCDATGVNTVATQVRFRLLDLEGRQIDESEVRLRRPDDDSRQTERFVDTRLGRADRPDAPQPVAEAQAEWNLIVHTPGLYSVEVDFGPRAGLPKRSLTLAVVDQEAPVEAGPFGWSLPTTELPIRLESLPNVIAQFGAGWIKLPMWFDMADEAQIQALVRFAEQLAARNIQCVGLLDRPPARYQEHFGTHGEQSYAYNYFRDPEVWEPLLEPVLTRLGMKVPWFQLGAELDTSLQNETHLLTTVSDIRRRMQAYAPDLRLALSWEWLDPVPQQESGLPWNATQYSTQHPLTAQELLRFAQAVHVEKAQTWARIDPLPRSQYALYDRVLDLVQRMIAIRKSNIDAAFIFNPFAEDTGLFTPDGHAADMLIPWQNCTRAIGKGEYVGSIEMPQASVNHIFATENEGVMIAWHREGAQEQLYLGNELRGKDIWGRPVPIESLTVRGGQQQRIAVSPWPTIISGIDVDIVRWRQNFELLTAHIDSRIGVPPVLRLKATSPFQDVVTGTLTVESDTLLSGAKTTLPFQIAPGQQATWELPLPLKSDASAGSHRLQFDFEIQGRQLYRFRLYRNVRLGSGDVELRFHPFRENAQSVLLRVEANNRTDHPMSFDCRVFSPGLPYQRFQLMNLPPGTHERKIRLLIPDAGQPVERWLRCEQIGTTRVLNYRVRF